MKIFGEHDQRTSDERDTETEQSGSAERECNCLIPYLEGAGQHSPGCSIFTPEEREANREEARRRAARYRS